MNVPETFRPKKNLEKKICELVKKPKNRNLDGISELDKIDYRIVYNQAKEVAEKLGGEPDIFSIYLFEDKKTGMVIEYASVWDSNTTHLRIDIKNDHSFDIVFRSVQYKHSKRQKGLVYIPGRWQDRLEQLYNKTKQK